MNELRMKMAPMRKALMAAGAGAGLLAFSGALKTCLRLRPRSTSEGLVM